MTDSTPATPGTSTEQSWTSGPFPPLWFAVVGSLVVLLLSGAGTGLCLVGSVAAAIIARRRPWVSAAAIVLAVWSGAIVLFTGRFMP
ncbi:hypothetical protein ACO229_15675 [Promicromonospora sp. MS192]|uniref:hypothetical protein n=1 Tax=Promicromonospora sp. MS192 TaxID=3412684 RepID=UPI003C2F2C98